jgi:hypothetical protein
MYDTVATLPGLAVTLLPALSRSRGLLYQDAGKTTLATADGDPVRVATCPFTGADVVSPSDAARATLKQVGGRWCLRFNGSSQWMYATGVVPVGTQSAGLLVGASVLNVEPDGNFGNFVNAGSEASSVQKGACLFNHLDTTTVCFAVPNYGYDVRSLRPSVAGAPWAAVGWHDGNTTPGIQVFGEAAVTGTRAAIDYGSGFVTFGAALNDTTPSPTQYAAPDLTGAVVAAEYSSYADLLTLLARLAGLV